MHLVLSSLTLPGFAKVHDMFYCNNCIMGWTTSAGAMCPEVLGMLFRTLRAARAYEAGLAPTAIDPTWGYEWALCCGYGCEMDDCECACENLPI